MIDPSWIIFPLRFDREGLDKFVASGYTDGSCAVTMFETTEDGAVRYTQAYKDAPYEQTFVPV